jgi:hypothetical protein
MLNTPDIVGEQVLNLGSDAHTEEAFVGRSTDPVILPQPYSTPTDFAAQFPQPLDTTEILAMCEEITIWGVLPELPTALKGETWRELNALAFTSGSSYISFADGECPEEYSHDGNNTSVNLKNIGAKKTLSISDIMHSAAVAAANWNGINRILGGMPSGEGMPGGSDSATFLMESISDVKDKEVRLAMTLVLNGWDRLLVEGDAATNALEFTGIQEWFDQAACSGTVHRNDNEWDASGSFTAVNFDRWLGESCAKPTHVFGHPMAVQEMLSTYFQLGYQGSQMINFGAGDRITPGYNFAGFVNTGIGKLAVVADNNFDRTMSGTGSFVANLYALRMTHNGVPLVYKRTQIPLAFKDLVPGCTAISFQVWAKTALVIKHCCAHGVYTGNFSGRVVSTCPVIG